MFIDFFDCKSQKSILAAHPNMNLLKGYGLTHRTRGNNSDIGSKKKVVSRPAGIYKEGTNE